MMISIVVTAFWNKINDFGSTISLVGIIHLIPHFCLDINLPITEENQTVMSELMTELKQNVASHFLIHWTYKPVSEFGFSRILNGFYHN